jgi:CRP/FNR family cyclic AMP-dependent transcriptional regulator
MAGRVLKVLEEQGLLRATGKTIVVFNARPKVKTRPLIVPVKPGTSAGAPSGKSARAAKPNDDEDDEDEESYE